MDRTGRTKPEHPVGSPLGIGKMLALRSRHARCLLRWRRGGNGGMAMSVDLRLYATAQAAELVGLPARAVRSERCNGRIAYGKVGR